MTMLIIFLVITVISVIAYIVAMWNETFDSYRRTIFGKIWLLIYAPIGGFIAGLLICALLMSLIGSFPKQNPIPDGGTYICAMGDGFQTQGSMFLGCGTVEGVSYYFYYEKLANGGYKQGKVKAENATIFEDNAKVPRIQYYKNEFVNKSWDNWAIPNTCEKISIYVPKGSVKQNFTFDLN